MDQLQLHVDPTLIQDGSIPHSEYFLLLKTVNTSPKNAGTCLGGKGSLSNHKALLWQLKYSYLSTKGNHHWQANLFLFFQCRCFCIYKLSFREQNIACDPARKSPSTCPCHCLLSMDLFALFAGGLLRCFMNINTLLYLIKARIASVKSPSTLFTFKMNLKADTIFKILSGRKIRNRTFACGMN